MIRFGRVVEEFDGGRCGREVESAEEYLGESSVVINEERMEWFELYTGQGCILSPTPLSSSTVWLPWSVKESKEAQLDPVDFKIAIRDDIG